MCVVNVLATMLTQLETGEIFTGTPVSVTKGTVGPSMTDTLMTSVQVCALLARFFKLKKIHFPIFKLLSDSHRNCKRTESVHGERLIFTVLLLVPWKVFREFTHWAKTRDERAHFPKISLTPPPKRAICY